MSSKIELNKKEIYNIDRKIKKATESYLGEVNSLEEYKQIKISLTNKKNLLLQENDLLLKSQSKEEKLKNLEIKIKITSDLLKSDKFSLAQKEMAVREIIEKIILNKYDRELSIFYYI